MDAFDFGYAASEPAAAASASPSAVTIDARELLRLLRLPVDVSRTIASAAFTLKRVARGESLYRAGDPFHSLYVVRAGFFKTVHFDAGGTEQVMGFPIAGDLLGAEGLAEGVYAAEAIALEAGEVVIVPFARLRALARDCSGVESAIYRVVSREIVRDRSIQWMLGTLGAEARVAAFLLDTARRFGAIGYSRRAFNLRMTRQEIGSYLGLKLETVSRALSAFAVAGWIRVDQKAIEILAPAALERAVERNGAGSDANERTPRRERREDRLRAAA